MKKNLFKKLFVSYKNYGFEKTNFLIIKHLKFHYELYKEKRFDLKYGIETRHHISSTDLKIESKNKQFAFRYEPIHNKDFYASMKDLDIPYEEYLFIDIGAGKGRALLLASEFQFKKFIGIEFSKEIYKIAKSNIDRFKVVSGKKANFKLFYQDAVKYKFPDENIVLFLYNPFDGEVLDKVIENIKYHLENTSKDFIIIYHYPMYLSIYNRQKFLKLIKCTNEYCIYKRVY